ncbi:hypothetical protein PVAP13_9NG523314 [Panicum virgatum]|uniref:Uncharacterized protein n=1 Tax=Panicum virgatum TaxID=38727 RepID=A0A8T0MYY2_PANVG|nr:hypothetical protein PVAP13_9NG523314 [Panicum virgatum]
MLDARERAVGNRRPARRGAAGALEDYRRRQGCSGATTAVGGAAAPPCGMGSSAFALIIEHFGEAILDELFLAFGSMVAEYLETMKAKYPVIVVSLKKAMH